MDKNDKLPTREEYFHEPTEKEIFTQKMEKFNAMLDECHRIVFFGGAGVSTESGIPDFRSSAGIYNKKQFGINIPPERILSRSFFDMHPVDFYDFYRKFMVYPDAKPNITHQRLAQLEKSGKYVTVVTQNIDGLHQAAGSKRVIELHGSIYRNRCTRCGMDGYSLDYIMNQDVVPVCKMCDGVIKPDVVLYEESLDSESVEAALKAISKADMLIVAGTSLSVYPAAGFIRYFKGKYSVVINLTEIPFFSGADLAFANKIGDVFDKVIIKKKKRSPQS